MNQVTIGKLAMQAFASSLESTVGAKPEDAKHFRTLRRAIAKINHTQSFGYHVYDGLRSGYLSQEGADAVAQRDAERKEALTAEVHQLATAYGVEATIEGDQIRVNGLVVPE